MMTGGAGRALVIAEPLVSGGSAARPLVAQPHAGPPASPPIDADLLFDCSLDKPSGAELIQQLRAQRERGAGATAATSSASFSPSPLGLAPPGRLALPRSQPMAIQHTRNESYGSLAAQGKCNVKPLGDFALGSTPRVWETEDEPPLSPRPGPLRTLALRDRVLRGTGYIERENGSGDGSLQGGASLQPSDEDFYALEPPWMR